MNIKKNYLKLEGYRTMKIELQKLLRWMLISGLSLISVNVYSLSLDDVSFTSLSGERTQIKMTLSETLPVEPLSFTIDNPARIAIDLPGVDLNLSDKSQKIGIGTANNLNAIESDDRTRVVISLTRAVSYQLDVKGKDVILILENSMSSESASIVSYTEDQGSIENIDFRRGEKGEGRIIVTLSDSTMPIDLGYEGGKVVVNFIDAQLPSDLDRKLDVIDFATPVKEIDTKSVDNNVKMSISVVSEDYEHLAYQAGNQYTIEFKPLTKAELEANKKDEFGYTGERLSLNFQSIEVRAVLQLIADFTGLNMVASDTISGNVTLRLKNVPWDQALDIILKSRGLAMRKVGNVIMVAPSEEISARERLELEASKQVEELAPLRTEFIQINYADAASLMALIQAGEESKLLSERGTVSIDKRTNTLIIQDIAASLEAIQVLVSELDVPIRQVLIESRIVNADESFSKDIGVRFGLSKRGKSELPYTISGGHAGDTTFNSRDASGNLTARTTGFATDNRENLIVDLPALPADASSLKLAVGKVGSYLLQLELSALIAEGRGENIASPRVITANQNEALIESGVQIPYQEASSSGATSTSFQDAVLSLRVTPHITPDDRIIMDLNVSQDTVSSTVVNGVPAINTRNVATQVLVDNGETVVLGGVYNSSDRKSVDKTPFFGDLPYVGFLFKRTATDKEKSELLIFITPKILKDSLNI